MGAETYMRENLGLSRFEALAHPFFCTVVNFRTGFAEYRNSGDLAKLIVASAALTPIFAPVAYEETLYIDGGFYDNLPAYPLHAVSEKIVGINVNPMFESMPKSFKERLYKSLFIMLNANIREGKRLCDLFIEPKEMSRYSIFDTKQFDLFYEIGYQSAHAGREEIERLRGEL
ncbi:Patatin-like phospholipase [compost metagenome]